MLTNPCLPESGAITLETPNILLVVAAAMIDARGQVLVQRRRDDKQHGGLWEFPGGKVESGESPCQALVRELAEELGVTVLPRDLTPLTFAANEGGQGAERPVVLLLHVCRRWQGDPAIPADDAAAGARIAWCDAHQLAAMAALPTDAAGAMPPLDVPLAEAIVMMLKCLANEESHP